MIDADKECPRCGDPGPPDVVLLSEDPDVPDDDSDDYWGVKRWRCRVCRHRFSPSAAASARQRRALCGPSLVPRRQVITRHAPRYL